MWNYYMAYHRFIFPKIKERGSSFLQFGQRGGCLKEVIAQLHNDLYYNDHLKFKWNSIEISYKIKYFQAEKIQITLIKVCKLHS